MILSRGVRVTASELCCKRVILTSVLKSAGIKVEAMRTGREY